jgi:hypothetical protein
MKSLTRLSVVTAVALVSLAAPLPALAEVAVSTVEDRAVSAGDETVNVAPFEMIAVSWNGDPNAIPPIEVHNATGWTALEVDTPGPDAGPDRLTVEAKHAVTGRRFSDPFWVGSADGYRVGATGSTAIEVHLIRESVQLQVAAPTPAADAAVAPDGPAVNLRDSWGAAPPKEANAVAKTIRFAVVHHTAGTNSYTAADVPAILRGIQSFHQNSRGWNDIAYNFLIDQWGGIWEGRAGGIGKPIVGSHAAGFNTGTVGISLLGNFVGVNPTQAAVDATAAVAGWKLALHGIDPLGTTTVQGTSTSPFASGSTVTIPTIVGHRDVGQTDCPGAVSAFLPQIRSLASTRAPYTVGHVDALTAQPNGSFRIAGWGFDRRSSTPAEVVVEINGTEVARSATSVARPDVVTTFGPTTPAISGFDLSVASREGSNSVCVYIAEQSYGALRLIQCSTFGVSNAPIGFVDAVYYNGLTVRLDGWALDPNTTDAIDVRLTVDGVLAATSLADGSRPDIAAAYPASGAEHGYWVEAAVPAGRRDVCLVAVNKLAGSDSTIRCVVVGALADPGPLGIAEAYTRVGSSVEVAGWALEGDSAGSINVTLSVNGAPITTVRAAEARADIARIYPGYGAAHGFHGSVGLTAGLNRICATAINTAAGANVTFGCTEVSVVDPVPLGNLDSAVRVGKSGVLLRGWAIDRDTAGPIPVLFFDNGRMASLANANETRGGLGLFFPGYGDQHGYSRTMTITKGRHNLCAYALNVGPGPAAAFLGCRSVRR